METTSPDIRTYIKKALENDRFINYVITLASTGKPEGYASDMNFASVLVTTDTGAEESFEVAVKCTKATTDEVTKKAFKRESYLYGTILPEFIRFQKQNNIQDIFNSVPKYYKTIEDQNMSVIVLENLKKRDYRLYDRKKPLDLDHVKLVLREYGKFHAISFALRNKSKDVFEKLVANYEELYISGIVNFLSKMIQKRMEITCDILKKFNKPELYEICHKILERNASTAMIELLQTVEPKSAILHGDCWSNNFMYEYESENHTSPTNVAILDWQISRLHSPVLDLSYFIYSTCSEEMLNHFDELLDTYYSSFSTFLTKLGCDLEFIFPYSTLRKHWKKYSLYGFLMVTSFLHVMAYESEDTPDRKSVV